MQRRNRDPFSREAQAKGFKSRAAFKLLQLDSQHRFFKPGQVVVDLGYAPGSWSQVAVERTKASQSHHSPSSSPPPRNGISSRDGIVVGIDVIPAQPPKGASTIQGDFLSPGVRGLAKRFLADAVLRRAKMRAAEQAREREMKAGLRKTQREAAAIAAAAAAVPARQQQGEEGRGREGGLKADDEDGQDPVVMVQDRPSYIDLERQSTAGKDADEEDDVAGITGMDLSALRKSRLVDVSLLGALFFPLRNGIFWGGAAHTELAFFAATNMFLSLPSPLKKKPDSSQRYVRTLDLCRLALRL